MELSRRKLLKMLLLAPAMPYVVKAEPVKNAFDYQAEGIWAYHFQKINVSADMTRNKINELGKIGPYHRYVSFPVE